MANDEGLPVLRERVARLETNFIFIGTTITEVKGDVKDARSDIAEVKDLISQARGAKWAIGGILIAAGWLSAWMPSLLKILIAAK